MNSSELPSRRIRDIRGAKFGKLTVIEFSYIANNAGKNAYWVCQCDCGRQKTISSGVLRKGEATSCGCTAGEDLYFIRSGDYVKIGRAHNVWVRIKQMETLNPHEIELIKILKGQGHREKEFHEKLAKYHHKNEWYLYSGVCEIA